MSWWGWPYGEGADFLNFADQEIVAPLYYLLCLECGATFVSDDLLAERCTDCRGKEGEEECP